MCLNIMNFALFEGKFGDQWKSCAICLEEMVDKELMVHTTCGGTLCHTCLEVLYYYNCALLK